MSSIPFYAKRFIAGANLLDALTVVRQLNEKDICVTLDALGENIQEKTQALQATQEYIEIIEQIVSKKLNAYISIKLTMIGLDIDEHFCYENLYKVLELADKHNIRVALDMEGSFYTERTIKMYETAAQKFTSPEIVLQAYLYRTKSDIDRVIRANGRFRLCKGAYKEPPEKAYQKMPQIVDNYKTCIKKALLNAQRVCIASHDDEVIKFCKDFIKENNIPKERYEFQMLYGLRSKTWEQIVQEGHNMTVYVPYGESWQAYYKRRLAERKENIFFIIKNFFKS